MQHRDHINLFWSEDDGCWIAEVPNLTYCSAHGRTLQATLHEVETATEAWLNVRSAEGREPPPARYRPAIYAAPTAA